MVLLPSIPSVAAYTSDMLDVVNLRNFTVTHRSFTDKS
jgi:hypothetical protein